MTNLDLSLIGNCQIAILVDGNGRYVWGCFPRYDSDPVFCSLLDGGGEGEQRGFFDVELQNQVASEQSYVKNTAILSTMLTDASGGQVRIIDYAPRFVQ
jgi:GH15 family glucan-1,4-alpha-glucosidase